MLGAGTLVFIYNVIKSLSSDERVGNDPWDAMTLEWTIPSPPPPYNFVTIPTVHSRDPFWVQKHPELGGHEQEQDTGQIAVAAQPVARVDLPDSEPVRPADGHAEHHGGEHHIHMPDPSYWPLVAAIGLSVAGLGILFTMALVPVGLGILIIGIYGWSLEPVNG
jgi:cytochrome c oxidase subunit 1